jgi:hypothetical protein
MLILSTFNVGIFNLVIYDACLSLCEKIATPNEALKAFSTINGNAKSPRHPKT